MRYTELLLRSSPKARARFQRDTGRRVDEALELLIRRASELIGLPLGLGDLGELARWRLFALAQRWPFLGPQELVQALLEERDDSHFPDDRDLLIQVLARFAPGVFSPATRPPDERLTAGLALAKVVDNVQRLDPQLLRDFQETWRRIASASLPNWLKEEIALSLLRRRIMDSPKVLSYLGYVAEEAREPWRTIFFDPTFLEVLDEHEARRYVEIAKSLAKKGVLHGAYVIGRLADGTPVVVAERPIPGFRLERKTDVQCVLVPETEEALALTERMLEVRPGALEDVLLVFSPHLGEVNLVRRREGPKLGEVVEAVEGMRHGYCGAVVASGSGAVAAGAAYAWGEDVLLYPSLFGPLLTLGELRRKGGEKGPPLELEEALTALSAGISPLLLSAMTAEEREALLSFLRTDRLQIQRLLSEGREADALRYALLYAINTLSNHPAMPKGISASKLVPKLRPLLSDPEALGRALEEVLPLWGRLDLAG